jgi:hypothetical protein
MLNYNPETKMFSIVAKDTGDFVITLDNYLLADGDLVYFTVNKELEKENPLIEKVVSAFNDHNAVIRLTSKDTDLPIGTYLYDV